MKIIILNGTFPNYDFGLNRVSMLISKTFAELGVFTSEICIPSECASFYDGTRSESFERHAEEIAESDGVILLNAVSPASPGAAMYAVAEHFAEFNPLKGKNCMIIILSRGGGSGEAMNGYGGFIRHFGGFDRIRVFLDEAHIKNGVGGAVKEIIEKNSEDYYRILRQNRLFTLPSPIIGQASGGQAAQHPEAFNEATSVENADLNADMKRDIDEITKFYETKNFSDGFFGTEFGSESVVEPPREQTCRQLTENLAQNCNPLAFGAKSAIQFSVSGGEEFSGYITIENGKCVYRDGRYENADVTILSGSDTWREIMSGGISVQNAFMTGLIKVYGNFALLTKLETAFGTGIA
jgi:putative sterol carrier protein